MACGVHGVLIIVRITLTQTHITDPLHFVNGHKIREFSVCRRYISRHAVCLQGILARENKIFIICKNVFITAQIVRAVDIHSKLSLLTAVCVALVEHVETAVLWLGYAGNNLHTGINDQQTQRPFSPRHSERLPLIYDPVVTKVSPAWGEIKPQQQCIHSSQISVGVCTSGAQYSTAYRKPNSVTRTRETG